MDALRRILPVTGLVALFAFTIYSCGGEPPPTPTTAPAPTPTLTLPPAPTPTVMLEQATSTPGGDDTGTVLGLPLGVFQNSQTAPVQASLPLPVLPQHEGLFRSSNDLLSALKLGAPSWVKAGTRITFYAASSTSAPGGDEECTEDPNGDWVDQGGKRYTCPSVGGDIVSAAEALNQVDVLSVEGTDVVLATTLFSTNRADKQYSVIVTGGGKTSGDVVDQVWINPKRLAEIANADLGDTKIFKGDYKVEDVTYKVTAFLNNKPGAYSSYAYETDTGLLVAATTRSTSANGKTQIYVARLLGHRQRNVPGLTGTNPAWVARTSQFKYSGTWTFANPFDPGSTPVTFPMDHTVTFTRGGNNWTPYTTKSVVHVSNEQETKAKGITGSSGQYWIDPLALARLKKGQLIDQDPYSEERLVVDSVDRGAGAKTVVISSDLPGNNTLFTYDLTTGALTSFQTTSSGTGITIQITLRNPPR